MKAQFFAPKDFLNGFLSDSRVSGHTHDYYRYPARFSPEFVRSVITSFSHRGDTIIDPFMGGGTTAVEALAAGRNFIGSDLNPLATFITKVKTTPLARRDRALVRAWLNTWRVGCGGSDPIREDDHIKNVPWWMKRIIGRLLASINTLNSRSAADFARCSVLRTAQWALDCRRDIPSTQEFLAHHKTCTTAMLAASEQFETVLQTAGIQGPVSTHRRLLTASAADLPEKIDLPISWKQPRLVVTSPPYPGAHILYHRWQVQGRRETPAAYWISGCNDGHGASFYTFAARGRKTLDAYFAKLRGCFASIAQVLAPKGLLVQLVAFSMPDEQLPAYLEALKDVGLQQAEAQLYAANGLPVTRTVPNRKWYANRQGFLDTSREFLLIHRKR